MTSTNSQQNQKLAKSKAVWNYDLHKSFIDLCTQEMNNNEKRGTFFSKDGWSRICTSFNRINDKEYERKQLKNHWDSTKADWKIWYKLKNYESGPGWNDEKNTIVSDKDWWNEYIQICPEASKFRYKGIDHADQLTDLFLEGMATGKSAWAPSQGSLPNDSAGPCRNVGEGETENFVDLESDYQNVDYKVDLNNDIPPIDNDTQPRRRQRSAPPLEPRRRASSSANLINGIERIGDVCEKMVNMRSTILEQPVTIKDCMKILKEMEDELPKTSPLYLFAIRLFYKQEHRDVFKELEHDMRVPWIENELTEANKK